MKDLSHEVAALNARYAARTPASRALFEKADAPMPAGNTRNNLFFGPYMPFFSSAHEATLTDVDGNDYIDLLNDFTVCVPGHSHPALVQAATGSLQRGMTYGGCIPEEAELAACLQQRFPNMQKLRFANSGTEACLYATQTVLAVRKRSKLLVFEGNYHGGVMNFSQPDVPINAPFDLVKVPYNDVEAFQQALQVHGDSIGAVIMELMMNSGGCIPAAADFALAVRDGTAALGIPLIIDEVMTARLGYHGLQGQYGIDGDITCLGKMIGGGFSAGAFGGAPEYMTLYDPRGERFTPHGGSFNNNTLSMRAGLVAMRDVVTPAAMAAMNTHGDELRSRLNRRLADLDVPMVFSGGGSVMNLHFGRSAPTRAHADPRSKPLQQLFHRYMLVNGVWVATRALVALSMANTVAQTERFAELCSDFARLYAARLREMESVHA